VGPLKFLSGEAVKEGRTIVKFQTVRGGEISGRPCHKTAESENQGSL